MYVTLECLLVAYLFVAGWAWWQVERSHSVSEANGVGAERREVRSATRGLRVADFGSAESMASGELPTPREPFHHAGCLATAAGASTTDNR